MIYSLGTDQILMIVLVVALVGVLAIMPIFTNKKRQQAVNTLYSSLKVGDKIMTIGGIIGTVKAINQTSPVDKEIIIETGVEPNKTTMLLDIKSLLQIIPPAMISQNSYTQSAQSSGDVSKVFESESEAAQSEPVHTEPVAEEPAVTEESVATVTEPVAEEPQQETAAEDKPAAKSTYKKTNSSKK